MPTVPPNFIIDLQLKNYHLYKGNHYWKTQNMELPKRHVGQGCTDFPKI